MNDKMISIFMQASTISVLFVVLLVVFFIALVAMTIALLASRSGNSDDDYDEDEELDGEDFDREHDFGNVKKASHKKDDEVDIGSIFAEADKEAVEDSAFNDSAFIDSAFNDSTFEDSAFSDSAFGDSALEDSAFGDSAFSDSAFGDSAFNDSAFGDSAFNDSAFMDSAFAEDSGNINNADREYADKIESVDTYANVERTTNTDWYEENDDEYTEVGDTDELIATDEQREFIEQLKKRDAEGNVDNASTDSAFADSVFTDSAFDEPNMSGFEMSERISSEAIDASVKEAVELGKAVSGSSFSSKMAQPAKGAHTGRKKKTNVPITDDFYWFNKLDVEEKPDYKTKEMYYHHFNVPEDCIEDLLIEMYDCALVRTEEIRYIAYGIEPRTISMKEIMGNGNSSYRPKRLKEPNAEDLLKIYAKWCSYVDELFEKIEIHADDYTTEKIRALLCEFGRSDVDEILEGK